MIDKALPPPPAPAALAPTDVRRPVRTTFPRRRLVTSLLALALVAPVLAIVAATSAVAAPSVITAATAGSKSTAACPRIPGHFSCLAERKPAFVTAAAGSQAALAVSYNYTPADLRAAYNIPTSATTATIAIIDAFDAPTVESDLAAYRAHYQLPACTSANLCFRKINQYGSTAPLPDPNPGWAQESTLDVEMVSAICPSCHILLIESDDDDGSGLPNMEDAVQQAIVQGAKYVSMSWGGSEFSGELTNDEYSGLNTPGVVFTAASGDNGYGTIWPSVNPNVVSVGGTSLHRAANARGFTEDVWGYTDGTGTGSGCSALEPAPSWQAITTITSLCGNRAVNDVSIVGDPNTGVSVYQGGLWWIFGGTSAGAPMIAALYAIAGDPSSDPAASYPYRHRAAFTDVTTNANDLCGTALCTGVPGWDGPSGLGTPIGVSGLGANTVTVHNPGTITSYIKVAAAINAKAADSDPQQILSYSASGLPAGTFMSSAGIIGGAPIGSGAFTVTVTATDGLHNWGRAVFRWNVQLHRIATGFAPRITGTLHRGSLVTASFGGWHRDTPGGLSIRPAGHVQWYRDGRAIAGATLTVFRIPATYYHHRIQFRLTATAVDYTAYSFTSPLSGLIG